MAWPIEDQFMARGILNSIFEHVLINPLVDFGILQVEYQSHEILGEEFREVATLRITPFGRGLLEALNDAMR